MEENVNYFTYRPYLKLGRAFNFIIGGRGVGKTFNGIYESIMIDKVKYIYMRRTQDEVDLIGTNGDNVELSPFAKVNARTNNPRYNLTPTHLHMERVNKNIWGLYNDFEPEVPTHVGMVLGLSTVSKLRGFDADEYEILQYDEFIPEKHVKKLGKGDAEGEAFLNAYETINRDREFEGRRPLICFISSNANDIGHPLLSILGLIPILERMQRKHIHFVDLPVRNATLTLYEDVDFKEKKKQTALYQLTKGTKFYDMALNNEFSYNDFSQIKSFNLKEFVPVCSIPKVTIYKHKSLDMYYASPHNIKCETYTESEQDIARFNLEHGRNLFAHFLTNDLWFEDYQTKSRLLEIIT